MDNADFMGKGNHQAKKYLYTTGVVASDIASDIMFETPPRLKRWLLKK